MYDDFDALIFDMDGTLVDSGQLHQYTWTLTLEKFGIPGTVRISFGLYNTKEEVDLFITALEKAVKMLS